MEPLQVLDELLHLRRTQHQGERPERKGFVFNILFITLNHRVCAFRLRYCSSNTADVTRRPFGAVWTVPNTLCDAASPPLPFGGLRV